MSTRFVGKDFVNFVYSNIHDHNENKEFEETAFFRTPINKKLHIRSTNRRFLPQNPASQYFSVEMTGLGKCREGKKKGKGRKAPFPFFLPHFPDLDPVIPMPLLRQRNLLLLIFSMLYNLSLVCRASGRGIS